MSDMHGIKTFATRASSPVPTADIISGLQHLLQSPQPDIVGHDGIVTLASIDNAPLKMQTNSTVNGVLIGLLSSLGSVIFLVFIFAVLYFFRYTQNGRILLDRIGRPGEYDDEQAFLREENEALEQMDDLQRTTYLRAKGVHNLVSHDHSHSCGNLLHIACFMLRTNTNCFVQLSYKQTHQIPCRPTYRYRSTLPYKRKVFQLGSLSPNSR